MQIIYHSQPEIEAVFLQYVEQGKKPEHLANQGACEAGVLIDDEAELVIRIPLRSADGHVYNCCLYRRPPHETTESPLNY